MRTVDSPTQVFNRREPIPGYVLRERIGEGGFGEVWKADAPGGLLKAVKIVYGAVNTSKAERELKALNRIKQVQHPLLLSLERIEVIDDHLVIVTELADRGLNDRFVERIQEGYHGIPRDELLGYMGDAADALDFLYRQHALQHLDVKPENLLLLAGRVKVADFGMVKDLHEQNETLVGGLTPLYAPPEIYDGKPNQHSDQYSLAVVFQQMLTGEPPFTGRTAAQLAAQHLHSEPNLSPLTESDKVVLRRALSKAPEKRFGSCRDFVEALHQSGSESAAPLRRRQRTVAPRSDRPSLSAPPVVKRTNQPAGEVRTLPPIARDAPQGELVPTVFLGVGSAAARCLVHLRDRLSRHFAQEQDVGAFQYLLLDSDLDALAGASRGEMAAFRMSETVGMPIREAGHYRANAEVLLEWIDRRWLYNIPRSLRTEGIRPLGRLAFVDNYETITEAIRRTISYATDSDTLQGASQLLGHPFVQNRVRVVILGSTTGGTSSGVMPDLPYAVRTILGDLNLPDDDVLGVLLYLTSRQAKSSDLQLANTVACLNELSHYATAGFQYPGEPSCGIPSFESRTAPFAHLYLAYLGERLTSPEFEARTAMVADYLFSNGHPETVGLFEQLREAGPFSEFPPGGCQVRGFAVTKIGGDEERDQVAIDYLCSAQIRRWLGDDESEQLELDELHALVERFTVGLDLEFGSLLQQSEELISDGVVLAHPKEYLNRVVTSAMDSEKGGTETFASKAVLETIDDLLAGQGGGNQILEKGRTFQELAKDHLVPFTDRRSQAFTDWFAMLARQPKFRLRGVQQAVQWCTERLSQLEKQLVRLSDERALPELDVASEPVDDQFLAYGMVRLQQLADRCVVGHLRTVNVRLEEYRFQLQDIGRRLEDLEQQFSRDDAPANRPAEVLLIHRRRCQLLVELEESLTGASLGMETLLELATTSKSSKQYWSALQRQLHRVGSQLVMKATARQRVLELVGEDAATDSNTPSALRCLLNRTKTELRPCGGAERYLLMVPEWAESADRTLSGWLDDAELCHVTQIPVSDDCLVICHEMSDIPLVNILAKLSADRSQCLELADRLHARVDVDWGRA